MSVFNLGITPILSFENVDTIVAGEAITLCNAAFDMTDMSMSLPVTKLNDCVIDLTLSDSTVALGVSSDAVTNICDTDLSVPDSLVARLKKFAENSTKGTIAFQVLGNPFADIGELENDELLSGEHLFSLDSFKSAIVAALKENNGDAIIATAEDIVNDLGLSDASGTDTGRNTSAPYEAGDSLDFNMLLCNGTITITVDAVHANVQSNDTEQNAKFYSITADTAFGSFTADGSAINGNSSGSNKYLDGKTIEGSSGRGTNAGSLVSTGEGGYVNGLTAPFDSGAVLVKFRMYLTA